MNRAVSGDIVVVEVFSEKEWKAPADEVVDQDSMSFCTVAIFLF
jgi:exosome complex exonuclease DIS3/RRP44